MEIKFMPSNNFSSRAGNKIAFIVNHVSCGSLSSMDNWFTTSENKDSSAHYGVGVDGSVHRYVKDLDKAWANGIVSNYNDGKYPFSNPCLIECGNVNPNAVTISIEHEGQPGVPLTEAQYQATLQLHKQLIADHGISIDADHIIGHYRIDPVGRMNCPSSTFPFNRLLSDLKGSSYSPPPPQKPAFTVTDMNTSMVVTASVLNVRQEPSATATLLGELIKDDTAYVTGKVNESNWYKVLISGGGFGYCSGDYLVPAQPLDKAAKINILVYNVSTRFPIDTKKWVEKATSDSDIYNLMNKFITYCERKNC